MTGFEIDNKDMICYVEDWRIGGGSLYREVKFVGTFEKEEGLDKSLKSIKPGDAIIFDTGVYSKEIIVTWIRRWNGFRKGKRVRPPTIYFRGLET